MTEDEITTVQHPRDEDQSEGAPECFTPPSLTMLHQWVRNAQPNAKLVYGQGAIALQCVAPVLRERVMELAEHGWLSPHFIRGKNGAPDRQIVMRSQRPFLKGSHL